MCPVLQYWPPAIAELRCVSIMYYTVVHARSFPLHFRTCVLPQRSATVYRDPNSRDPAQPL